MKFLKQADHIEDVLAKLSKYVKINLHPSSDSYSLKIF